MATQQQKAKELVDIFHSKVSGVDLNYISKTHFDCQDSHRETAKQCALITCDEMIQQNGELYLNGMDGEYYRTKNAFLFDIKQEITKLT